MITRIELKNFMSHAHTVIEPAAGLTVLVGPNNVGKSAVVAALQILCSNENSTYVMRHGAKDCAVIVQTDDGHQICWRRKTSPSYEIDGQKFDRLRTSGAPDELHRALKLPKVNFDGSSDSGVDVHFGAQKSPIFLLNGSASESGRFFASSSDASHLLAMQRLHKERVNEARSQSRRLEQQSLGLNQELATLEAVVPLDAELDRVEQHYRELLQAEEDLHAGWQLVAGLQERIDAQQALTALKTTLAPLTPPPELLPASALAELIREVQRQSHAAERNGACAQLLRALPAPLQLPDPRPLRELVGGLAVSSRELTILDQRSGALLPLSAPPELHPSSALAALIQSLQDVSRRTKTLAAESQALTDLAPLQLSDVQSLREFCRHWSAAQQAAERSAALDRSLVGLAPFEQDAEAIRELARLLAEVANAERSVAQAKVSDVAATAELAALEADLMQLSVEAACPLCGGELDAARARAVLRNGAGHAC